jgi:hypothetical protein
VRAWRRKAIELLPEKKAVVEQADSPMVLWIELNLAAKRAYEASAIDDKFIRAVFTCARYCWASPDGDVSTAVVVAFFENIGTGTSTPSTTICLGPRTSRMSLSSSGP